MNYQIRIRGHLDLSWQGWLAELQIVHEPSGTTLLSGPLPDQAALFGVLLKLNLLGLILLSLEANEPAEAQEKGECPFTSEGMLRWDCLILLLLSGSH